MLNSNMTSTQVVVFKKCRVCGNDASGHHFNVLACEACKAFFRRAIRKNKYGGPCGRSAERLETGFCLDWRHKCKNCRLKMCIEVGMEILKSSGGVIRQQARSRFYGGSTSTRASSTSTTTSMVVDSPIGIGRGDVIPQSVASEMDMYEPSESTEARAQMEIDASVIQQLLESQSEWENPREADMQRMVETAEILRKEGKNSEKQVFFKYITELTEIAMFLIDEEARRLPGFSDLLPSDQILLLESSYSETIMLRAARHYCVEADAILVAHNLQLDRDDYRKADVVKSVDYVFKFCADLNEMGLDDTERALLFPIVIFSEREDLNDGKSVTRLQEMYTEMLLRYMSNRYSPISLISRYAKLLAMLLRLRTLGKLNDDERYNLLFIGHVLPPKIRDKLELEVEELLRCQIMDY